MNRRRKPQDLAVDEPLRAAPAGVPRTHWKRVADVVEGEVAMPFAMMKFELSSEVRAETWPDASTMSW
ncbi:hypothetical protein DL768_000705 [Monosporascus sp. mg162]|nr:hypothetical protein DL768_000705 [Monosporascus sp. mg162]